MEGRGEETRVGLWAKGLRVGECPGGGRGLELRGSGGAVQGLKMQLASLGGGLKDQGESTSISLRGL